MAIRIDLHVHTQRYSPCSTVDPLRLIGHAVKVGLDGLVITEHHYQWYDAELDQLAANADAPGFILLAGFEYASRQGDILMYGLDATQIDEIPPGLAPAEAVAMAQDRGAVSIAAHPTRAGLGFDEEILTLPVDAIETRSVNLRPHEQRLAANLAVQAGKPAIAASDAHRLSDVGRYGTDFLDPIRSMADLQQAIRRGRFHPANELTTRTGTL